VQDSLLPQTTVGQLREHRLYQADWLLRFYGFTVEEILDESENLSPEFDPKCAWALKNLHLFPVEINRAPLETLLRVPGIGVRNAHKILQARRFSKLSFEDLLKMRIALKRAKHFITCDGKYYGVKNELAIRGLLVAAETQETSQQLNLFHDFERFSSPQNALTALTGQF
jgi:predicted DNA-binding helix-hairpin-helix protein